MPEESSRGENVAIPSCPGKVPITPPATPDFAGIPTEAIHLPAPSYIPAEAITACTCRQTSGSSTCSPVTGWIPPSARVTPITARSFTVTMIEH